MLKWSLVLKFWLTYFQNPQSSMCYWGWQIWWRCCYLYTTWMRCFNCNFKLYAFCSRCSPPLTKVPQSLHAPFPEHVAGIEMYGNVYNCTILNYNALKTQGSAFIHLDWFCNQLSLSNANTYTATCIAEECREYWTVPTNSSHDSAVPWGIAKPKYLVSIGYLNKNKLQHSWKISSDLIFSFPVVWSKLRKHLG